MKKLALLLVSLSSWYFLRQGVEITTRIDMLAATMFVIIFYLLVEEKK